MEKLDKWKYVKDELRTALETLFNHPSSGHRFRVHYLRVIVLGSSHKYAEDWFEVELDVQKWVSFPSELLERQVTGGRFLKPTNLALDILTGVRGVSNSLD